MIGAGDDEITTFISRILLRYFRQGALSGSTPDGVDRDGDRDLLRLYWAISPEVRALSDYVLTHRHEAQSVLTSRMRADDGPIRGRLDARATLLQQLVSGHPAITVSHEPVRSFATGPNHVLGWVVQQSWLLADRFLSILPADAAYRSYVERAALSLSHVRKVDALRRVTAEVSLSRRPDAGALKTALRSRRVIYRLAASAYMSLLAIEAGEERAIQSLLSATLIAPIDVWRRFELATALALARALEAEQRLPATLNILSGNSAQPIARVGSIAIFWQTRTRHYEPPPPEPSELVLKSILAGYGMRPDADRPDLVVVNEHEGRVVGVVEAKYFAASGEDAWDRLRDAAHQLVRYARGYRALSDIDDLLARSIIALVRKPVLPECMPPSQPAVVDFADMQGGGLSRWARLIQPQASAF